MSWGVIVLLALIVWGARLALRLVFQSIFDAAIPEEVTDISQYETIRKANGGDSLVSHFPMHIPEDAIDPQFSAFPGFLQGGGWMRLTFDVPEGHVQSLLEPLQHRAVFTIANGTPFAETDMPKMYVDLLNEMDWDRPVGSTVFITDVPAEQDKSGWWNHGYRSGAYFIAKDNRFIYWAEWW